MRNRWQSRPSIPQGHIPEKSRIARAYFPIRANDRENAHSDLRTTHGLKSQGAGSLGGESLFCCCPFSTDHCSEEYNLNHLWDNTQESSCSVRILYVSFWTVASSSSSWDKSKAIHHRWGTEKMGQGWWLVGSIKCSAAEPLSSGQRNRGQWEATVLP